VAVTRAWRDARNRHKPTPVLPSPTTKIFLPEYSKL
jgi:hypothetical protein